MVNVNVTYILIQVQSIIFIILAYFPNAPIISAITLLIVFILAKYFGVHVLIFNINCDQWLYVSSMNIIHTQIRA